MCNIRNLIIILQIGSIAWAASAKVKKTEETSKKIEAPVVEKPVAKPAEPKVKEIAAKKTESDLLKKVITKYQTKNGVKADVEKSVHNKIMNKDTSYSGKMYWYSGKFKWDCETPEKSTLLYDGKYIWSITENEFFDPKLQVTRTSINSDDKKLLVNTFSEIMNRYKVKSSSEAGSQVSFDLEATSGNKSLNKNMTLKIDKDKKEIVQISYRDDLDNTTTIKFKSVSLKEKLNNKQFQYSPPKGVAVKDI